MFESYVILYITKTHGYLFGVVTMFESYVILYITKTDTDPAALAIQFESYVILYITKTLLCYTPIKLSTTLEDGIKLEATITLTNRITLNANDKLLKTTKTTLLFGR
mgnify:CR=1 FL=1